MTREHIDWMKIDHFTGLPYKKNPKSGTWNIVDYVAGDLRITEESDGTRVLTKGSAVIGRFKTLKAAKEAAENC
jgi:hypothetical protein